MGGIVFPQPGEGIFQRSPQPSERDGLLLGDLVVENVGGSAIKAKLAGHGLCIAPLPAPRQADGMGAWRVAGVTLPKSCRGHR